MSFENIDDTLKINPVVELKEEIENQVLKADFCGHLQLVSVREVIPLPCNTAKSNSSDKIEEWNGTTKLPVQLSNHNAEVLAPCQEESVNINPDQNGTQLDNRLNKSRRNRNCNENGTGKDQGYSWRFDCCYRENQEYPSANDAKKRSCKPKHSKSSAKEDLVPTQAEKKRLYRMKMKKENPAMWLAIKEKEAMRKRELRQQRRNIIHEMQSALEVTAMLPDSPEYSDQKMYLEALKERYPEIWIELLKAIPETEERNQSLRYPTKNNTSPKPARMYRDVIAAKKKRLYRQRLKEERPEMYERQKAREALAKSQQRLMLKNIESSIMDFYRERPICGEEKIYDPDSNNNPPIIKSEYIPEVSFQRNSAKDDPTYWCGTLPVERAVSDESTADPSLIPSPSPIAVSNNPKTTVFHNLDHKYVKSNCPPTENSMNALPNIYTQPPQTPPSSTQSDMLWYWNDTETEPLHQRTDDNTFQELTEEQKLDKLEQEILSLKEKRRQYRSAMAPERREKYLKTERERAKRFRLKMKGG